MYLFNSLKGREFPGRPVVRVRSFHCHGPRFDPWWENEDLASFVARPKEKKCSPFLLQSISCIISSNYLYNFFRSISNSVLSYVYFGAQPLNFYYNFHSRVSVYFIFKFIVVLYSLFLHYIFSQFCLSTSNRFILYIKYASSNIDSHYVYICDFS